MIHSHILGIPMIGSTAMVHVVPGKWQLHVIMAFVVLVWHMTRKSLVSAWISWIYRTINTYSNMKIRQYDVMSCVGILYFFDISIHVAYLVLVFGGKYVNILYVYKMMSLRLDILIFSHITHS